MRTRHHRLTLAAAQRFGLAGEQGLFHQGFALHEVGIGWKNLTWSHFQDIAYPHLIGGNHIKRLIGIQTAHTVGQTVDERLQRASGFFTQTRL